MAHGHNLKHESSIHALKSHNEITDTADEKDTKQVKKLFLSSQKPETEHKVGNSNELKSTEMAPVTLRQKKTTAGSQGSSVIHEKKISSDDRNKTYLSPLTISKHQLGKTRRRKLLSSRLIGTKRAMSLPVPKIHHPGNNWPVIATNTTRQYKMEKLEEEEEGQEEDQEEEQEEGQEEEHDQEEEEEGEEKERENVLEEDDDQEKKMSRIVNITTMAKQWKNKIPYQPQPRDEADIQRRLSEALSKDILGEALQEAQMLVGKTESLYRSYLGSHHILTQRSGQHAKYLQEEVINKYNECKNND